VLEGTADKGTAEDKLPGTCLTGVGVTGDVMKERAGVS